MKQLLKSVLIVLGIVFALNALLAAGLLGSIAIYYRVTNKCTYREVDRLPSPAARLAVVRTQRMCTWDEAAPLMMFALLPSGAPFDEKESFLRSSDYDGLGDSFAIFAKWIDDSNLLVAVPDQTRLKTAPSEFDGIHIQYGAYPLDVGTTRTDSLKKLIEKKLIFEPSFGVSDGVGVPGIGCLLTVNAFHGEYLDELSLDLSARKALVKNAYSVYDFQISARDETARLGNNATGAEVVGFSPKDGKSKLWTYLVFPSGGRQPNGKPMAKWIFGYTPANPHDVISIAEELKSGSLTIRVGYWLDDTVVVYSMQHPVDAQKIDEFERCIADNHIFDTPSAGKSRE